ncbi:MAG: DUF4123 domain-containing protein [Gammaproteobacteria bacterium]|nr:DUF4123 domain-containing protein [Gammaproteobacteria bacterium]
MDDTKQTQANAEETELSLQQQFYNFSHSQSHQAEHLYILFNSANHPHLPQQYYSLETEQHYIGLLQELLEGYNEQSIPVMPYLVKINRETIRENPFINWLFSSPETLNSFFALTSHADLEHLAAHWNSISLVYNCQQQVVIMRLFDSRISQAFFSKISKSELQQLIGPCQSLWFPNESGLETVFNNSTPINQSHTAPWFHLSEQHEIWLAGDDDNALLYNLTLYLWENHPEPLAQYSPEIIESLIAQSLKKALKLGFTKPDTIYFCASLFFYYSPILYQNHLIQTLWSQSASEQEHLQSLREKITEQQWQQMVQPASMDDWMNIPEYSILVAD